MGKKKQKRKEQEAKAARCGAPGPAAGIAAALARHAASPEGRQMLAAGLTMAAAAASVALTRGAVAPAATKSDAEPAAAGAEKPAAAAGPTVDPQAIVGAITEAAEQALSRLFGPKKAG